MMKRVRLFHMKVSNGGRNKEQDAIQDGVDANGDFEESKATLTKSKTKNGLLTTLRWRWNRSKRVKCNDNHRTDGNGDEVGLLATKKIRPTKATSFVCPANCPVLSVQSKRDLIRVSNEAVPSETNEATCVNGEKSSFKTNNNSSKSNSVCDSANAPCMINNSAICENEPICKAEAGASALVPSSMKLGVDFHDPPRVGSLTQELFKLSKCGWYWGPITRSEAEEKLLDQTDGAFLVRDSSDDRYLLSLSFRSFGKTLHTRIEHCNGLFSFYAQPELEGHTSIIKLIEQSMNYSQSGVFCYSRSRSPGSPSYPVRLTKPVSRFTQVRSLQYLCRFVIRQYTRFDHIQKLPLPSRIKGYLEEGHY